MFNLEEECPQCGDIRKISTDSIHEIKSNLCDLTVMIRHSQVRNTTYKVGGSKKQLCNKCMKNAEKELEQMLDNSKYFEQEDLDIF